MAASDSAADFRSDTVTLPSRAMRAAMADAEVGDDVLDGDPTVRALEREAARWLGKPGALFVPSGTMANQVAVGVWTRPGDELIVSRGAHVVRWEAGAAAALHGVQAVMLPGPDGEHEPDAVARAIRPADVHGPRTGLVGVEQTFMGSGEGAGGRVVPLERLEGIRAVAADAGVPVHMDGARLANAVVASGVDAARFAAQADSVSLCFSKGLGAPVGSVVAGDEAFLERARVVRKRLGGWMRQAGVLAAAARIALERNVERLAEDHDLARELAEVIRSTEGLATDVPDTNIVMVRVEHPRLGAEALRVALEAEGVRALCVGEALRFVTHLGVGPPDVARLREALGRVLRARD